MDQFRGLDRPFGVTIEVLWFYNLDGGRFHQVISGASTKSLNQGAHRRYVAPLNSKLDVRNVQTLLMISQRTLKKASSHHSGCVCTQQAPNLPLTQITDGLFTELGTHT
jgi:hypothetical protein